ncbi:histone acetyltransferase, partial [Thraustotheca clavata]
LLPAKYRSFKSDDTITLYLKKKQETWCLEVANRPRPTHTVVDESDESSSSESDTVQSIPMRHGTGVKTIWYPTELVDEPRQVQRREKKAGRKPKQCASKPSTRRPSRYQTVIDLTGPDGVEIQAETPSSNGNIAKPELDIAPSQVVKKRKLHQYVKTLRKAPAPPVRRTPLPPIYAAKLLLKSKGYKQIHSHEITFIIDLIWSFLGGAASTAHLPITGSFLWKQFSNVDLALKLQGQQLLAAWHSLQEPLKSGIPPNGFAISRSSLGIDLWRDYEPRNMAECLYIDKMRRYYVPSSLRRKSRNTYTGRKTRYQIIGHHIKEFKEFKPPKRPRTENAPPKTPPAPTPAPPQPQGPVDYTIPDNVHTTGVIRSLPDEWKYRELDEQLHPVRPFQKMNRSQIALHVKTLKCDSRIRRFRKFMVILTKLMEHPRNCNGVFNIPVDPIAMNLPTYNDVICEPMDLGTIKKRLDIGAYETPLAFASDVRLVFANAMLFNGKDHWVHVNAQILLNMFEEMWANESMKESLEREKASAHACSVCAGHTCAVCDEGCLELTLPHYQCFGNCGTIFRKGNSYYLSRDGTRMWCLKCKSRSEKEEKSKREEDGHEDHQYPRSGGGKRSLWPTAAEMSTWLSKKKCEVDVEPWVRCSLCSRWMHQICVLFNPIEDAYSSSHQFVCPLCIVDGKDESILSSPADRSNDPGLDCTKLPECPMSRYLEKYMREAIDDEEAKSTLFVRVTTFDNHRFFLPPSIANEFAQNAKALRSKCPEYANEAHDLPPFISFGTKSIFLFQKQQGVDVCLFAMYVQEYNDDCEHAENRRTSYLAYIDSVRYLQPAVIRTLVYHQVILGYFDYSRHHGIERIHIWSCPPQRSQSYVFWCHPHFQKTPGVEHLRNWYKRLLEKAKEKSIISGYTTLYDRYLAPVQGLYTKSNSKSETPAPTKVSPSSAAVVTRRISTTNSLSDKDEYIWPVAVPFFDGDLIPAELDRIIRHQKSKKRKKHWSADAPFENDRPPALHHLRETFIGFLSAMKAVKEDLLVVDLARPKRPLNLSPVVPTRQFTMPQFVGSRFSFHQLSLRASYQFDSLRRAKHSTMMLLHQMFNYSVPQANVFCAECALLITHAVYWTCTVCPSYSLCDWCHKCHSKDHPHSMHRDEEDEVVEIISPKSLFDLAE